MRRALVNERGQALLELATLGIVAIAALGFLIRVGMQANFDQEVRMGAFRRALAAADAANHRNATPSDALAVGYYYVLDRQMPDPADGFMGMSRNRSQASAFVEWGDHLTFAYEPSNIRKDGDTYQFAPQGRKTQPLFIVRQNEKVRQFRQIDFSNKEIRDGEGVGDSRGFAQGYTMKNTVNGTVTQGPGAGGANTTTTTTTKTTLNIRNSNTGPANEQSISSEIQKAAKSW